MKKAVFSFFTMRTSGDYSWWDDFPIAIGKCLKEKGIDHICFYRGYSDKSRYPKDIQNILLHKDIQNPFKVKQIVAPYAKRYDKVIFHHQTPSFLSGLWVFNRKFNRRYSWITTEHDSWSSTEFSSSKRLIRSVLRGMGFLPNIIIGCSRASDNRITNLYGSKGVGFIYNGINLQNIPEPKPLNDMPTKVLFVGRLEEYKGLWPLVNAFRTLEKTDNTKLTIVGNGPLYKSLSDFIAQHDLGKRIVMMGHSYNISELMLKHDFIVIPSTYEENCPITSLEAQAHYLPCIYSNSGGLPETQIQGKTGIMIEKNNPDAIINAIKYFQEDRSRFNQMRLDARTNSLNFSINKMAEKYCELYLKVFNDENIASI